MSYLLDANAFIQPKNDFYRMSFCPGYWDWIVREFDRGTIRSVRFVRKELVERKDDLSEWINTQCPSGLFVSPTSEVIQKQAEIAQYVSGAREFKDEHRVTFLGRADPWLIAEAVVNQHEIITFEERVGPTSKKVKIPNVASHFGVECVSLYDVLESTGALLPLDKAAP